MSHSESAATSDTPTTTFDAGTWRDRLTLITAAVVIALFFGGVTVVAVKAIDVLFLVFLATVFAVFLHKCAEFVGGRTGVGTSRGLIIVVASLVTFVGVSLFASGGVLFSRVQEATKDFDKAVSDARSMLNEFPVADQLVRRVPGVDSLLDGDGKKNKSSSSEGPSDVPLSSDIAKQAASVGGKALAGFLQAFSTTFGAITSIAVVFFIGVFLAATPELYLEGITSLVPEDRREAFKTVAGELASTLWAWLLGRGATMVITGLGIWAAMAALGVPLAGLLAAFTAVMVFIPNIGGLISGGLAALLALPKGLATVGLVLVAYTIVQLVEGYVLTPLIQQRAVSLPPALLIASQLLLGTLCGFLGVMVATPLVAIGIVLVKRVYVDDVFTLFDAND